MDHKSLESFIILADTLHYRKASTQCGITTSALSRMIQRMEAELGCILLERNNKEVSVTKEGILFYSYAKKRLAEWKLMRTEVSSHLPESIVGEVHITCSVNLAADMFISKILGPFIKDYTNVRPVVEAITSSACDARLLDGSADFAIGMINEKTPKNFLRKVITTSELVFIYPAGWYGPEDVEDLERFKIAACEYEGITEKTDRFFRRNKVKPNICAYIDGMEGVISSVASGMMSAIIPRDVVKQYTMNKNFKVAENININEEVAIGFQMKKNGYHSPAKQALWQVVHQKKLFPDHKLDVYR